MTDIIVKDIKNGSEYYYGGSGEANETVYVTQAEYDALTPDEHTDYVIYDTNTSPIGIDAESVSFDNTQTTMQSDNVQDAIEEVFQSVSNGKELLADAITDKGVQTSASDSFSTMASNIESIVSAGSYGKVLAVGGRTTPNNVTVGEHSGKYEDTDYTIFFNTYVSQSSGSVYSFDGIMYVVEKSTGKIYAGYGGGDVSRENSRGNVYTSLLDCGDYFTVQACNDENGSMFGRYGALKFDKTTKEITFHASAFDDYTTLSPLHNTPKTTTTYNDGRMSGIMRNTDLGIDTDEYKNRLYYSASHDTNYNHNFTGSVIELF